MFDNAHRKDQKTPTQERLNSSLVDAVKSGAEGLVVELLEKGADVHTENDLALRWAAGHGCIETIELLLAKGANVHAEDEVPIRMAARLGQTDAVELLLQKGAHTQVENGFGPLSLAASSGHSDTVKLLLDNHADVHANHNSALRMAAMNGHLITAKILIQHGANVNSEGGNILARAAAGGHTEVVRLLLNNGANLSANNESALAKAATFGRIDTIKVLIQHGAHVQVENDTPLRNAADRGHIETVKLLLEEGANIHAARGLKFTYASRDQSLETRTFLKIAETILDADGSTRKASMRNLARLAEYSSNHIKNNAFNETKETFRQSPIVRLALHDAFVATSICKGDPKVAEQLWRELFTNTIGHVEGTKGLSYSEYLEQVQAGSAQVAHAKDMFSEVAHSYFLPKRVFEKRLYVEDYWPVVDKMKALAECVKSLTEGRTSLDIARLSTSWHKAGNQLPDELVPFRAIGSWYKLIDDPFKASNRLEVHVLSSPQDLKFEGEELNHCVGSGSYASECRAGITHILSVREEGIPLATAELVECAEAQAELTAGDKHFRLRQFQGKHNGPAPVEARAAFAEFLAQSKELSLSTVHGETERLKALGVAVSELEREIGYPLSEFAKQAPPIEQHYRERVCFHKGHDGKQVVGLFPEENGNA